MRKTEWVEPEVFTGQRPEAVWVKELDEDQAPPVPDPGPILAWHDAYRRDRASAGEPPQGMGVGHYQRIVIELDTGAIRFSCGDWRRRDDPPGEPGAGMFPPHDWKQVTRALYWVIDSGTSVVERPFLTVEQGNELAHQLAPLAQELLDGLLPVSGTEEFDWSPESAAAGWEINRACYRSPEQRTPRDLRSFPSMAQVVEGFPDVVQTSWADLPDSGLDQEAGYLTRLLGNAPAWRPEIRTHFTGEDGAVGRGGFEVVGTRAWLYEYRAKRAADRKPVDADRWFAEHRVEVSADLGDRGLLQLADQLQRDAGADGALLIGLQPALQAERARVRERLVKELATLGTDRAEADKAARLARAAVTARLTQIIAWTDPSHSNWSALGSAAGWSRQAVSKMAGDILGDGGEIRIERGRQYLITCPNCHGTDTEEFGVPVPNTDDFVDAVRCMTCRREWVQDPAANAACTICGGTGDAPAGTEAGANPNDRQPCSCVEE